MLHTPQEDENFLIVLKHIHVYADLREIPRHTVSRPHTKEVTPTITCCILCLNRRLMQDNSKESVKRFSKLEYFDSGDLLYFFIIFIGYF